MIRLTCSKKLIILLIGFAALSIISFVYYEPSLLGEEKTNYWSTTYANIAITASILGFLLTTTFAFEFARRIYKEKYVLIDNNGIHDHYSFKSKGTISWRDIDKVIIYNKYYNKLFQFMSTVSIRLKNTTKNKQHLIIALNIKDKDIELLQNNFPGQFIIR